MTADIAEVPEKYPSVAEVLRFNSYNFAEVERRLEAIERHLGITPPQAQDPSAAGAPPGASS